MTTLLDRRRGCLIGLAVGDALGAAIEFQSPGMFELVEDYRGDGPHGLAPGEWTDDTSLALALGDSIAKVGWDLADQCERYVSWWKGGDYSVNGRCFDIGTTTRAALSDFSRTDDPWNCASRSEQANGNGSIMRLAPVPIRYADFYPERIDELARLAEESSLTTHACPQCLSACRLFAVMLAALMQGETRATVLNPRWSRLAELREIEALHPEVDEVASGSYLEREPPEIKGSGYVVRSLEAALWAFAKGDNFREAVLAAVNLGDDADTTGAVCGQLAGARWGESGIPAEWRNGLAKPEMIESVLCPLTAAG